MDVIKNLLPRLLLALAALSMMGCSFQMSGVRPLDHDSSDVSATTMQMRLRMRGLVDPMSGQIERAADGIIAKNSDREVRRAAVEWKSQAVPALRESLFQPQPIAALFDTWVLLNQMVIYFDSGDGSRGLGTSAPTARDTCLEMEHEFAGIVATMTKSGDVSESRKAAREWAAAHPIRGSISYRESTLSRATEVPLSDSFTAGEAIADITMTVDDLNRKVEIYTDQLPRQVRWEAEMMTMDLAERYELERALPMAEMAVDNVGRVSASIDLVGEQIGALVPLVDRLAKVAEEAPGVIAAERAEAIGTLQEEISRTIEFVEKEREIALQHITAERLAALQTLHETIIGERQVLLKEAEGISVRVVDHAFQRMVMVIGGVLAALAVVGLIGLLLVRRMVSGLLTEFRAV